MISFLKYKYLFQKSGLTYGVVSRAQSFVNLECSVLDLDCYEELTYEVYLKTDCFLCIRTTKIQI